MLRNRCSMQCVLECVQSWGPFSDKAISLSRGHQVYKDPWRIAFSMWAWVKNPMNLPYGYGSIPINTIFSGMNIHLPAILGFTRYQGFDPSPYVWGTSINQPAMTWTAWAGFDLTMFHRCESMRWLVDHWKLWFVATILKVNGVSSMATPGS